MWIIPAGVTIIVWGLWLWFWLDSRGEPDPGAMNVMLAIRGAARAAACTLVVWGLYGVATWFG